MDPTTHRWNDDRLDEFGRNVDRRFDEVDKRFDKVEKRFDKVDERMDYGFNRLNDRLDDLVKAMILGFVTLTGGILAGFAAILVLIATQI